MRLIFCLLAASFTTIAVAGYKLGDEPADFKLKALDGSFVSLNDFVSFRGVVVVFTSNNCQQSQWYEDRIIELGRKISLQGWKLIVINSCTTADGPDETSEGMQKRAEDKNFEFPYLRDESQSVARAFGVIAVPEAFVLRSTGSGLEVSYMGSIDDSPNPAVKIHNKYVEIAVSALTVGARLDTPMSKVNGCQIKMKGR